MFETGGLGVWDHPGLHSRTLRQINNPEYLTIEYLPRDRSSTDSHWLRGKKTLILRVSFLVHPAFSSMLFFSKEQLQHWLFSGTGLSAVFWMESSDICNHRIRKKVRDAPHKLVTVYRRKSSLTAGFLSFVQADNQCRRKSHQAQPINVSWWWW